jgi:multiple sugar transport system ATP-binding protein
MLKLRRTVAVGNADNVAAALEAPPAENDGCSPVAVNCSPAVSERNAFTLEPRRVRLSPDMGEIGLEGVTKAFAGEVLAVDDVNLTIGDGEFMVLVGPSGCGKTTLLRTIGGLEEVTAGRIRIADRDVTKVAPSARDVAMVFQNYALYPHMTVRKNLGYGLRVRRTPKKEIARRVEQVARMLGLEQLLDRRPGQLSGGQQQRVAMGRAIIREPAAYLMDEPLSNLDAKLRVGMRTSLQQLHSRLGTTTVYVTHDQVEAMTLGERVAVMSEGRIQQVDVPQRLYEEPANLFVAGFIGSPAMNLVEASFGGDAVVLGETSIPLDRDRRPQFAGVKVILGIRPEAFEDAAFATPGLPQFDVRVEVVEELGADAFVFFEVDAKPIVVEEAVSTDDEEANLLAARNRPLLAARVDPRTAARVGETIRLAVDPARFQFFAPDTGESLLGSQVTAAAR